MIEEGEKMGGILSFLLLAACLALPFTFVFFLIYAIREAVKGGDRDIAYGLGAAISLLAILAICLFS